MGCYIPKATELRLSLKVGRSQWHLSDLRSTWRRSGMLIVVPETHLDHALSAGHIRFIFDLFKDRNSFFLETVELPASLPPLPCSLRGPAVGLPPVPDAEVVMKARNGRAWPSRMMLGSWAPLDVHTMTVIAGPGAGHLCVLYTAYGGPAAPREPGDPSLQGAELVASEAFWAKHALVG